MYNSSGQRSNALIPGIGLGGSNISATSTIHRDRSSGANLRDSKALRDEKLHALIGQDVGSFQRFVKEQKQFQEEITQMCTTKAMEKVEDDIKSTRLLLCASTNDLKRQEQAIGELRRKTTQECRNAESASVSQKRHGLQHENRASDYFCRLVEQFEVQMRQYRQQVEDLETHMETQSSVSHITQQDLFAAMHNLYQAFITQAAQLQAVHENVKKLKHEYLTYRRVHLGDSTDVFEAMRASNRRWQNTAAAAAAATTGPNPFFSSTPNTTTVVNMAPMATTAAIQQQQQQQLPPPSFSSLHASQPTSFKFN